MSTPAVPKLRVGRIGDLVLRADGTPKTTGEFAYSSDLFAAGRAPRKLSFAPTV